MRAAIVVATLVAGLAACASTPAGQDAAQGASAAQTADEGGFPSLRGIPTGTDANTDAAYWAAAEAELISAGQAVRAHPRAQVTAEANEDPATFVEDARRDLEQARQAHEAAPQ